ncbi:MAG: His/Gly/Thr/Pro-type tRNA ligase C-terminal domain-containing protein, partial [Anaerolineales bacterium]|nr:His/Gly/Thr/Pro-type tRNA ligase C-terminal domain-containing protein [Anaerolineales bacterium]
DACPKCGGLLRSVRGVEVGNIFKLGTRYSDAMGCTFLDRDGQEKPVIMGSYGIGSGRLLACVAEEHHDGSGLVWPISIAPYQVHLVALSGKEGDQVAEMADEVYALLNEAGVEVLYDDREESPGVKFNDADLIGLPIRLTVSERAMHQGGVEFKRRDQQEKHIVPEAELLAEVKKEIATLEAFIRARVVAAPFDE